MLQVKDVTTGQDVVQEEKIGGENETEQLGESDSDDNPPPQDDIDDEANNLEAFTGGSKKNASEAMGKISEFIIQIKEIFLS